MLLLLASCAKPVPITVVEPDPVAAPPRMEVVEATLDNGLTVYLSPNPQQPRISARVVVRAGSAQDPRDATGMAHYLEHLLANKGTERLGTTDHTAEAPHLAQVSALYDTLFTLTEEADRADVYAQIAEASAEANQYAIQNELKQLWGVLGGRGLNAYTNSDTTVYLVDLPANRLAHWATIEGDRFRSPVFRSFQTEVETVYEEKNRSLDSDGRAVRDALRSNLFRGLPYDIGTLGTIPHLKNPSVSKSRAYFDTWYVPGNMAVVLAGDFDPNEALSLVETHLGTLPTATVLDLPEAVAAPLDGELRVDVVHRGNPSVTLGWRTVPYGHPDHAALVLADILLANGATGLIDRNLINRRAVRQAGSYTHHERLAGSWILYGIPQQDQSLDEIEGLLLAQIESLQAGAFDDADLEAAVRQERIDEKLGIESNDKRVSILTTAFRHQVPWTNVARFSDQLAEVTRAEVIRVANTYLGGDRVAVHKTVGKPDVPSITAPDLPPVTLNTEAHSAFYDEVVALSAPAVAVQELIEGTDYVRTDTDAGPLYVTGNPFSDLFQITWRYPRGSHHDPSLCTALSLWDRSGIGESTLQDLETWRYRAGIDIEVSCDRFDSRLTLRGEAAGFDDAVRKLQDRIANPRVDPEELPTLVDNLITSRTEATQTADFLHGALSSWALEGDASPHHTEAMTDDEMRALRADDLLAAVQDLWEHQATIDYVGTLSADAVAARVAPAGGAWSPLAPPPSRAYVHPAAPRVLLLDHDDVQAKVRLYLPHEILDIDDLAEHRLLGEYLGGSAGLVFQEVRESRGLAYSASGGYFPGRKAGDDGFLWGVLGCQADKTSSAATLLMDLVTSPLDDPGRFARAKAAAIEKLLTGRIPFRSYARAADEWRQMGLIEDPRPDVLAALQAQDPSDLAAFVDAFATEGTTLLITGDLDRIDVDALAPLGEVQTLTLDDLVRY